MSEQLELQTEEREALQSIYEGDTNFKEINSTTFQYKYGEEDSYKSFLVEIKWGENYPTELPNFNLDAFYNRNISAVVKQKILAALKEEADQWIGCGVTYTLFEFLKDRIDDLTVDQPEAASTSYIKDLDDGVGAIKIAEPVDEKKKEVKKEQLTKSQKRKQWERTDHKGEKPRGYDWVDIVKHLSQTGSKADRDEMSGNIASTSNDANNYVLQPLNI